MAEITVTQRTKDQGKRLQALRKRTGLKKPTICARLDFGSTQTYDLYERGVSVIRLDRVSDWADAFGVTPADFVAYVIDGREIDLGWTFRDALRGHIPESLIDELAAEWEGRPIVNQQSAVEGIKRMAARRREDVTQRRRAIGN